MASSGQVSFRRALGLGIQMSLLCLVWIHLYTPWRANRYLSFPCKLRLPPPSTPPPPFPPLFPLNSNIPFPSPSYLVLRMEYRRILCTFLHHSPAHIITASTRQVLSALLTHCYNPEGLSRSLVATITQELSVLNEEHGYGLSIEEVQNYWFSITLDYQPTHPSSSQTAYDPSSINNDTTGILPFNVALPSSPPTHTETRDEPPFRNPRPVAHHPNQKVDLLLANAYNIVVFTWMTDFLLYRTCFQFPFLPSISTPPPKFGLPLDTS